VYKLAVRDRDHTTTGGRVFASSAASTFDEGKLVAFGGSLATCGNCKGSFPIIASYDGWTDNGKYMVVDRDRVTCPCGKNHVLAGSDSGYRIQTGAAKRYSDGARVEKQEARPLVFDECVQLCEAGTQEPLRNVRYRFVSGTSIVIEGITDATGRTRRINTNAAESLELFIEGV
jgi:uncharacterized Zn-binding protein involved in type VI secretion